MGYRNFHAPLLKRTLHVACATLLISASMGAAPRAQAAPPTIAPGAAVQLQAIDNIKTAKTATQRKIDSRLFLGILHERNDARLASLTSFRFIKPESDGRVPVDIAVASVDAVKPVVERLSQLGAPVRSASFAYRTVFARVKLADMEQLAAMTEVRAVRPHIPGLTQKINTSEGDKTHGADEARGFFGVTGAGIKVCAMSDGVDSLATIQASGDLPANVDVLPGQAGAGDEGTAMLEIVHDLAPGAALGFAQAGPDEAGFAQNILGLAISGCNIIVDDVIYLDESPFEDGPVAQAVNTVTNYGVLYFSSAGNQGNKTDGTSATWEGDFKASAAVPPAAFTGKVLHDFGDAGQSISVIDGFDVPLILIWAEHYDLSFGFASTDYDAFDMSDDLTTVFDASTNVQDGAGGDDFPIEFLGDVFGGDRIVVVRAHAGTTSSAPMFNMVVFSGSLDPALATTGATRGHSASAASFSVAATPAGPSFDGVSLDGPFPGLFTGLNTSEDFSSDGPRRIILDSSNGAELTPGNRTSTGGIVRSKPDITAADGVSVATPGFNPFYGTSAAAPHAAAIAALLKSGVPTLTPVQVRTLLTSTAIDIEAPGGDNSTGVGIVMPHAALLAAGATPKAFLGDGTAVLTEVSGDGDLTVENYETFSIVVPLTNNGGAAASAISAVLSSATPGISVTTASSAYPNLAISASANNATPFVFSVGSLTPCGANIDFTLTVSYTGGSSPQVFNFSVPTGAPGTPVATPYSGAVVPIADAADLSGNNPGAPAIATLPVAGVSGNVLSAVLSLDGATCSNVAGATTVGLDHTYVSDLRISLTSPQGTSVMVIDRAGGGGNDGNNFCGTVLDDSGTTSIEAVTASQAPFTGTFTPNAPLAGLRGQHGNGNWKLQAQDFFSGDTGNIRAFTLTVTPAVCNAAPSDRIFANDFE